MDAIYKRRSIRKFTSEPVSEKNLKEVIRAGMNAPSAGNERPWYFIVINERKLLDEIPKIHPYSSMLYEAPVAVAVCGDLNLEKYEGYWVQDCSAATQNMLLEIADLGLGGVWLGVHPIKDRVERISRLLGIPENVIPLSLIAIGHPAENKEPKNEFDEQRIKYNRWV
jgi:nitroreductase